METLAYLHSALVYEAPDSTELVPALNGQKDFTQPNWKKLSSCALTYMLPLAVTFSILGIAAQAQALQEGERSSQVTTLQQRLQSLGYFKANVTGYFGPLTKEAVMQFQKAKGLTPDGVVGSQTQAALGGENQKLMRTQTTRVRTTARTVAAPRTRTTATRTNQSAVNQSSGNFLGVGARGEAVQALQESLRGMGYYRGSINGVFDTNTEAAVRRFQQAKRLTVDGVVGPQTRAALPAVGGTSPNIRERRSARRTSPNVQDRRTSRRSLTIQEQKTAPSTTPNVLEQGQTSQAVVDIQRQLRQLEYFQGRLTGYFDQETKEAVIQFQQDYNLPADGVVGANTLSVLQRASERSAMVALQKRLQEKGFYNGALDGKFDQETKAAVEAAQRAYGLSADDIVNKRF